MIHHSVSINDDMYSFIRCTMSSNVIYQTDIKVINGDYLLVAISEGQQAYQIYQFQVEHK